MFTLAKKIITTSLLFSLILTPIILPKETSAQYLVEDMVLWGITTTGFSTTNAILSGAAPGTAAKEGGGITGMGLDGIAYLVGQVALRTLTQSVVNWINSGFEGNPSFIEDTSGFLMDIADRTAGNLIEGSDLAFLCEPFKLDILRSLNIQYSPYVDDVGCRLSDALINTEGAVTEAYTKFMDGDFIGGGGWDTWLQVTTVPQNNQIGAMLIAQGKIDAAINTARGAATLESNWGMGMLSYQDCYEVETNKNGDPLPGAVITNYQGNPATHTTGVNVSAEPLIGPLPREEVDIRPDVYVKRTCKTVTPGSVLSDAASKATGIEWDRLGAADEFNEVMGALANFMISKVLEKGFSGSSANAQERAAEDAAWRNSYNDQVIQLQELGGGVLGAGQNSQPYDLRSLDQNNLNTSFGSGTNADPGTGNPALDLAKGTLATEITGRITTEETYLGIYTNIFNNAKTMQDRFINVVACYQGKLNNTSTLNLTASEITMASTSISLASTTANTIGTIKNTVATEVVSATNNKNSLSTLLGNTNNALDEATINQIRDQFTALLPSLHTEEHVTNARTYSTYTLAQIQGYDADATQKTNACAVFPPR